MKCPVEITYLGKDDLSLVDGDDFWGGALDRVEPVAKLCLEKLLLENYSELRKEGAKCLRFCVAALEGHPEK